MGGASAANIPLPASDDGECADDSDCRIGQRFWAAIFCIHVRGQSREDTHQAAPRMCLQKREDKDWRRGKPENARDDTSRRGRGQVNARKNAKSQQQAQIIRVVENSRADHAGDPEFFPGSGIDFTLHRGQDIWEINVPMLLGQCDSTESRNVNQDRHDRQTISVLGVDDRHE